MTDTQENILITHGPFVAVERIINGKVQDYSIKKENKFVVKEGKIVSFTDLKECESYFSGLCVAEVLNHRMNNAAPDLATGTYELMQEIHNMFTSIKK